MFTKWSFPKNIFCVGPLFSTLFAITMWLPVPMISLYFSISLFSNCKLTALIFLAIDFPPCQTVIAKGDAREVGHTISDSSQYLARIMFINLFSASIKL